MKIAAQTSAVTIALALISSTSHSLEITPLPGAIHVETGGWRAICWQVLNGNPGTYLCQPVSGPKTVCHISLDGSKVRCETLLEKSQLGDIAT